jgi:hypothetical protein
MLKCEKNEYMGTRDMGTKGTTKVLRSMNVQPPAKGADALPTNYAFSFVTTHDKFFSKTFLECVLGSCVNHAR